MPRPNLRRTPSARSDQELRDDARTRIDSLPDHPVTYRKAYQNFAPPEERGFWPQFGEVALMGLLGAANDVAGPAATGGHPIGSIAATGNPARGYTGPDTYRYPKRNPRVTIGATGVQPRGGEAVDFNRTKKNYDRAPQMPNSRERFATAFGDDAGMSLGSILSKLHW